MLLLPAARMPWLLLLLRAGPYFCIPPISCSRCARSGGFFRAADSREGHCLHQGHVPAGQAQQWSLGSKRQRQFQRLFGTGLCRRPSAVLQAGCRLRRGCCCSLRVMLLRPACAVQRLRVWPRSLLHMRRQLLFFLLLLLALMPQRSPLLLLLPRLTLLLSCFALRLLSWFSSKLPHQFLLNGEQAQV